MHESETTTSNCHLSRTKVGQLLFLIYLFIFIFLHVQTKEGERIQISELRFMKRGPQSIELPIGDMGQLAFKTKQIK
jgi:hypothetical protein